MSSTAADRRSAAERVLDLLAALCEHPLNGMSNAALAAATRSTPHQVTRDMAVLMAKGWARKDAATRHFFPTPAFARLIVRVDAEFRRAEQRLADLRHAFTSGRA